ncbi:pentatricopeptide repeat-containing protein DOT4, chloroplastic-like [Phalaenopsis equestris]|uniref:pentatricopeptide repeat-containing protein DOT4, chloroplastic-like n=1 Tax=Phalaenopsis equestris TaxID=78828 RepID=UPI0009E46CE7|nr:pentatricopeptide repeat-containing protein DOT4, chloroplastic-like [Phalaenopsis equestris]
MAKLLLLSISMTALARTNPSHTYGKLNQKSIGRCKPIPCSISFAHQLFDESRHIDDFGKAALIRSLSRQGEALQALDLFRDLAGGSLLKPAAVPLAAALRCCTTLQAVNCGREVHGFLVRNGGEKGATCRTESALVCLYVKCELMSLARKVFDRMPMKDVVSWTIILMGYANGKGLKDEVMCLFLEMLLDGIMPNRHTITVIMGCASFLEGKQLQAYIAKNGWDYDAFTGSSLIDMYAKNGDLVGARLVFDRIEHKDVVCYNSLILGYGRSRHIQSLISIFIEMCLVGLVPNHSSMVGLLNSCALLGLMSLSRQFHAHAVVRGYGSDKVLQGIIIDMYAKCGDLESARAAFDRMGDAKSIAGWNSMICGYGKHGHAMEAFELFDSMQQASFPPQHITFTCLLSACSHSVWGSLLAACKVWEDADIGEIAARKLFEIEPESSGSYVVLANMFAADERWDDAALVRRLMDGNGIKKDPGSSLISVRGDLRKFRTGEGHIRDCREMEELIRVCRCLNSNILTYV